MAAQQLQGDEFGSTRAQLQAQIDDKKRMLVESKPIGQRIDNTRAALDRSRRRLAQAVEALSAAQAAVEAATADEMRLASELADLEASVTSAAPAPETYDMATLEEHLLAAVSQIRQLEAMRPGVADDAQKQCADLVGRFRATMEMAARMSTEATDRTTKRLRINGKQPPESPPRPPHRLSGKQPMPVVQRRIEDFFGPLREKRTSAAATEGQQPYPTTPAMAISPLGTAMADVGSQ